MTSVTPSLKHSEAGNNSDWKPYVVLSCSDTTFLALASGESSSEFAYMRGLLKIKGSMGAALKVKALLERSAKMK